MENFILDTNFTHKNELNSLELTNLPQNTNELYRLFLK